MTVPPTTPAGVLELLPAEQAVHDAMLDKIRRGFRRFGFPPIETPVFERTEVLLTKSGGETERQVYFVQSAGARDQGEAPELALRFDLTVPLARYVAEHQNELVFPFRRSQIQRVYRGERPQRGRYREFYQCDIDVIDRDRLSLRHDAEVAAAAVEILGALEIGKVTLRLNSRRLMRSLLTEVGVSGSDSQTEVLREVDKLDRRGSEAVAATLERGGMDRRAVTRLLQWTSTRVGGAEEMSAALADLPVDGADTDELLEVARTMDALGVPADRYMLDLAIARGLDYYTGTVYETTLDDHPELGSICSGGRYDDLAGEYTDTRLPGVGISIGFTRLFWQLREAGLLPTTAAAATDVSVLLLDEADLDYSLALAGRLRKAGVSTETTMEPSKLGRQLRAADRRGVRLALIAGESERAGGTVSVKDLQSGEQVEVVIESLVEHVTKRLSQPEGP